MPATRDANTRRTDLQQTLKDTKSQITKLKQKQKGGKQESPKTTQKRKRDIEKLEKEAKSIQNRIIGLTTLANSQLDDVDENEGGTQKGRDAATKLITDILSTDGAAEPGELKFFNALGGKSPVTWTSDVLSPQFPVPISGTTRDGKQVAPKIVSEGDGKGFSVTYPKLTQSPRLSGKDILRLAARYDQDAFDLIRWMMDRPNWADVLDKPFYVKRISGGEEGLRVETTFGSGVTIDIPWSKEFPKFTPAALAKPKAVKPTAAKKAAKSETPADEGDVIPTKAPKKAKPSTKKTAAETPAAPAKSEEPTQPARPVDPGIDFVSAFEGAGKGIADVVLGDYWKRTNEGTVLGPNGVGEPILQATKIVRDEGGLKTRAEFDDFVRRLDAIDKTVPGWKKDFAEVVRAEVAKLDREAPADKAPAKPKKDEAKPKKDEKAESKPPAEKPAKPSAAAAPVAKLPKKPDGKTAAEPVNIKDVKLPPAKEYPEKVRDEAKSISSAIKAGVKEYNDVIKQHNDAIKKGDTTRARQLAKDAGDYMDGLVNRLRTLAALQRGERYKAPKKGGEEELGPPKRERRPVEEEEIESPTTPASTTKIDLVPVKGRAPKVGDTIYKPFPYAPEGYFEGKVVKSRDGEGLDVVYVNPRTGKKTRLPLTDAWSTAKPVPADQAKPVTKKQKAAPEPQAPQLPASVSKSPFVAAVAKNHPVTPHSSSDVAIQIGDAFFYLSKGEGKGEVFVIDDFRVKPEAVGKKQGSAALKQLNEYADKHGVTLIGDPIAQSETGRKNQKAFGLTQDQLLAFYERNGFTPISKEMMKANDAEPNWIERAPGAKPTAKKKEEVAAPKAKEEAPAPAPKSDTETARDPNLPEGVDPDVVDWNAVVNAMPATVRAEIRTKLDSIENGGEGKTPIEVASEMKLPLMLVQAVPTKGPLGPFGQASFLMREWMKEPFSPFLDDMVKAVDKSIDTTDRAKAADAVMDALAGLVGKTRSSVLSKDDYDKINEFLVPRISKESMLNVLEAMEYQSKYSQAVREVKTNPFWIDRVNTIRDGFFTNWESIPEQIRRDLLAFARAVGEKYGPRVTKDRKLANLFTDKAVERAFNETLERRGSPLFDDPAPRGNVPDLETPLRDIIKGEVDYKSEKQPNKEFAVNSNGTMRSLKNEAIGTSAAPDSMASLGEARVRIGKMTSDELAAMKKFEARARVNALAAAAAASPDIPSLVDKMQWEVLPEGLVVGNEQTLLMINALMFDNPMASAGFYMPSGAARDWRDRGGRHGAILHSLEANPKTRALAEKFRDFTEAMEKARLSTPFNDLVFIGDVKTAPYQTAITFQEELAHRADFRAAMGLTMLKNDPKFNVGVIKSYAPLTSLPAFQKAVDKIRKGGYQGGLEVLMPEIVAKSFRSDGPQVLGITNKERWDIIEKYAELLGTAGITPESLALYFGDVSPAAQEFIKIYEDKFTSQNPPGTRLKRSGNTDYIAGSPEQIRQSRTEAYQKYLGNPAKYEPQFSVKTTGKGDEVVITTPQLKDRKVEYVVRGDGHFLRSPNHPEVKLSQEEINAIAFAPTVQRPGLEDLIYVHNLQATPIKLGTGKTAKNILLQPFADYSPFVNKEFSKAMQPVKDFIQKEGPAGALVKGVGKAVFIGWRVWRTKRSIRANIDISAGRQASKAIFTSTKPYRALDAVGEEAMAINDGIRAEIGKVFDELAVVTKALADPKQRAAKKQSEELLEQERNRLMNRIMDLQGQIRTIDKSMTEIRLNWTGGSWARAMFGSLASTEGFTVGGKKFRGSSDFLAEMHNDPLYDVFEKNLLQYGAASKPREGQIVANYWNTGELVTEQRTIKAVVPELLKNGKIVDVPKSETYEVLVVRLRNGKTVEFTNDWRLVGEDLGASHDIHGYSFLNRVPIFESQYGKRTLKEALASKDAKNITGYFLARARQIPAKPFVMFQDAFDMSLAYLRHHLLKHGVQEMRAKHALEGTTFNPDAELPLMAQLINYLSGTTKAKPGALTERLMPLINIPMFSGRWTGSNFALINPALYVGGPRTLRHINKWKRGHVYRGMLFYGMMLMMADRFLDLTVDYEDATHPGWLKIQTDRYGSFDILPGFTKVLILAARNAEAVHDYYRGVYKVHKGRVQPPKDPLSTALDTSGRFISLALSPEASDIYVGLRGETVLGKPTNFTSHFLKTWGPITLTEAAEDYMNHGWGDMEKFLADFIGVQRNKITPPDRIQKEMLEDLLVPDGKGGTKPNPKYNVFEFQFRLQKWRKQLKWAIENEQRRKERKERPRSTAPFSDLFRDFRDGRILLDENQILDFAPNEQEDD